MSLMTSYVLYDPTLSSYEAVAGLCVLPPGTTFTTALQECSKQQKCTSCTFSANMSPSCNAVPGV